MKHDWVWEIAEFNPWVLMVALNSADHGDETYFHSRIDGLLDPFWRSKCWGSSAGSDL